MKPSEFVGLSLQGIFDVDIGDGLFSTKGYDTDEDIVEFVGEQISLTKQLNRSEQGRVGYFIKCNKTTYIDCYQSRHQGICLASCVNSAHTAYPLKHKTTGAAAVCNVRMEVRYNKSKNLYVAKYVALHSFLPGVEVLGHYEPFL